ncbi:hypothetical protein PgNI_10290 [Pyricularia grisea]|uniref:Uncharacterized protein n=1 Tax=Pyricularia grisea TaxID=148305 RepID=A0A6P8AZ94_PYRGI|nr:hypothetical protein PgNI_10290 [Pyricularia grisea]TLD07708.1 hypothetical protein PgNI_10290 [Pyricularia grisea]
MENHSLTSKGESLLPLRLLNNPIDETVLTVNGDERVFVGGKGQMPDPFPCLCLIRPATSSNQAATSNLNQLTNKNDPNQ